MSNQTPIKVMIIDDSPFVRGILTRVLAGHPDIQIVASASDPIEAKPMILALKPGVIILDVEMPRMDGITFLTILRRHYPVPVIVCSGAAPANSQIALDAIAQGAVDVVCKPREGGPQALKALGESLAEKVRAAAKSKSVTFAARPAGGELASFRACGIDPRRLLIAIGASTGGTEALKALLSHMCGDFPPIVMVQHMPEDFTGPFARRLDQNSSMHVTEAVDGDALAPGRAYLARGGTQMRVTGRPGYWRIAYGSQEPHNRHCPSVCVLFDSVAKCAGAAAIGVILTGMGADGAAGLLNMRRAGAVTFGQDKGSCVVYGMPKAAAEMGAVEFTGSPDDIPHLLVQALSKRNSRVASAV